MYEVQDLFTRFDQIEMLVIKTFGLIGLFLICFLVLWSHIQSIWEITKQNAKMSKRRKRRSANKKKPEQS